MLLKLAVDRNHRVVLLPEPETSLPAEPGAEQGNVMLQKAYQSNAISFSHRRFYDFTSMRRENEHQNTKPVGLLLFVPP
jgi:hypothetical protein